MARAKQGKKQGKKRGSSKKAKNSLAAQLTKVNRILREREPALVKLEQRKCALEKAISLGRKTVTKKIREACAPARGSKLTDRELFERFQTAKRAPHPGYPGVDEPAHPGYPGM